MRKHESSAVGLSIIVGIAARRIAPIAAVSALAGASIFSQGCTKVEVVSAPADAGPTCKDTSCVEGNVCISDGKETKCRRPCETQDYDPATGCPRNWKCALVEGAEKQFCVKDNLEYAPAPGQWGALCNPAGGFLTNPDCDFAHDFWCYGKSPTDAHSFCTQYQCQTDGDCRGGYYCATINKSPSVVAVNRSQNLTTTVCLPREYCAPCATNVDCPPDPLTHAPQYCVTEPGREAKFCTRGCDRDANCRQDAHCAASDEAGANVCFPRAGVCKGDGSFCSPCSSDDDCPGGLCIVSEFNQERFCSIKSKIPCVVENDALKADCPKPPTGSATSVSCGYSTAEPALPKDQCYGRVDLGGNPNPGCWSKKR